MAVAKRKPGRPSLSEHQKEEIRNNIIEIARDLFVNEGYENTSMRRIAAQAGFAPTKIYYYFENKKSILKYFWEDISEELWRYCKPSEQILNQGPLDTIRHLMRRNVQYWLDNPKSYQLGIATQDHNAELSDNFDVYSAAGTGQYIELMHQCVEKCIREGIFRLQNKILISQVIAMSVYGSYSAFYSLPTVAWIDKNLLIKESIENTLRGLQA